jgi:2-hydroxychromene-2-carboxylate isomerase
MTTEPELKVDFYFSVRSPYSYLILPRMIMLRNKYDININFKLVYPIAIRMPEFFKRKNLFTYFGWKMIDMKFKARRLGMKMVFPMRPDPIQQEALTGKISDHQPYIFDICHFLQAVEKDKQLDFALEVSKCIFGGVKDWHTDESLIGLTSKLGLNFHEIKERVLQDKDKLIDEIKKNQKEQLQAGHHGVPLSVFNDKFFFGQDKFDELFEELRKHGHIKTNEY